VVVVGVHREEARLRVLVGDRVEDRAHDPARRAPGGVEVDDDRHVGLEHVGGEAGVGGGGEHATALWGPRPRSPSAIAYRADQAVER
jgi:hypothetical protein